jgi:glycosyltransferase involved in cell wall biosynthesis
LRKIIFGITGLTLGGAERVLVDIVNELSQKYEITIFTLYGKGEFEKELNTNIKLINYTKKSFNDLSKIERIKISLKLMFNKKSMYKKFINKGYDTEIAFLEGPITRLFSVKNNNVKKIAWVHNDIGQVFGKNLKAKIKIKLDKKCYSQYNDVVFVSNDNKEKFEDIYKLDNNKIVIPNYISIKRVLKKSEEAFENVFESNEINFLSVARLAEQKAIDRLIKVHSRLIGDGYNHKFYVIGEGSEREKIESLIEVYNVKKSFILLGKKDNPYPYMKNCDIFALMSLYEGLPMTILESKILDKPILITDTASREAVQNYYKSYITENSEQGIYDGVRNCIELLPRWRKTEKQDVYDNYDIIRKIEKLVN